MKHEKILMAGALLVAALLFSPARVRGEDPVLDHNNVVIVLDASGSMKETMRGSSVKKMDAAKMALKEVLNQVPRETHIGLLVFTSTNLDWVYPLGPRDDARLEEAINLPQADGGTPLGRYMKIGVDRLLEQRAKQHGYGTYRLLVVTDGEASDQPLVDRYAPEIISRGITVDVIGVDMKTTHTLATKAHSYRRADDPASLKKAVAEVFAEVAGTGSDAAGADAFELIAPLPDEVAQAMLKSLSTSGNQPIGEGVGKRGAAKTARPGQNPPGPVPQPGKSSEGSGGFRILLILFAVIAVFIMVARKSRR